MSTVVLIVRILLSGVLGVAGAAKLADVDGSRRAMEGFGVPRRIAGASGRLLPVVELGVATALLIPGFAWWGGVGAAALFGLFVAVITVSLARGNRPDCHCFGQLHSAAVSPATLLRNAALVVVAAVVVVSGRGAPQLSPVGWVNRLSAPELVLAGLVVGLLLGVALLGWFLLELFRQNGRILQRLTSLEGTADRIPARPQVQQAGDGNGHQPGLPVGMIAPAFELPAAGGGSVSLRALVDRGLPVLLVFSDPQCGPCEALLPEIAGWQHRHSDRMTIALVSRRTIEANAAIVRNHGVHDVLVQSNREIAEAYGAPGTPSAILVSVQGRVARGLVGGVSAITELVTRVASPRLEVLHEPGSARPAAAGRLSPPAAGPTVGDEVPNLEWTGIDRQTIALTDLPGASTGIVFWNPGCGFCERLLPDLVALENSLAGINRRLILMSTGTTAENRALGLRSPIVLEDAFETGRLLGASGTPSAVIVDSDRRIATTVAVGGPAVLKLLSRRAHPVSVP